MLYHFCSDVNHIDNADNILKRLLSQLVLEHEELYDTAAKSNGCRG